MATFAPARPLLVVPGIVGSGPAEGAFDQWLTTRGIEPDSLEIDPIAGVYNDTLQTLQNVGYTLDSDLFAATYDWRMTPGPNDGVIDGQVSGITADSITDTTYEFGVDYLGYWMQQASDEWLATHGVRPDSVDIVAHSTGGLVARSYIQSSAYDSTTSLGWDLPAINDLVMIGVPNRGASLPWNVIHNDFSADPAYRLVMSKIADQAWRKFQEGTTITGPDGDIVAGESITETEFISRYVPTVQSLLATYEFYDDDGSDGIDTFETVNNDSALRNNVLLDLNDGLDLHYTLNDFDGDSATAGMQTYDPNAFADELDGNALVIYGSNQDTATRAIRQVGTPLPGVSGETGGIAEVLPFSEYFGHVPVAGEVWFEDVVRPASELPGDGTVPTVSSVGQFQQDSNVLLYSANTDDEPGSQHTKLMSNLMAQEQMLTELGVTGFSSADISTDKHFSAVESAARAIQLGIVDVGRLAQEAVLDLEQLTQLSTGVELAKNLFASIDNPILDIATQIDEVNGGLVAGQLEEAGDYFSQFGLTWANKVISLGERAFDAVLDVVDTAADTVDIVQAMQQRLTQAFGDSVEVVGGLLDYQSAEFADVFANFEGVLPQREIEWRIQVQSSDPIQLPFSIGRQLGIAGLETDGMIDANVELNADIEFGLRLDASNPADAFFLRVRELSGGIKSDSSNVSVGVNVGALGADVTNGQLDLDASFQAFINHGTTDTDRFSGLSLDELQSLDVADMIRVQAQAAIDAQLPLDVSLGGFSRTGMLTIQSEDAAQAPLAVTLSGFDDLMAFADFDMNSLLDSLGGFEQALATLADSPLLDIDVPFVDANAGELVDSTLKIVDLLRDEDGQPTVKTIQGLVTELTNVLGLDLPAIGIDFDILTKELSLHLELDQSFGFEQVGFGPSFDLGPVSLGTGGSLEVDASLNTTFDFVASIEPLAAVYEATMNAPADGNFTGQAEFEISTGNLQPVTVSFSSSNNTSVADLVIDLQAALDAAGLASLVVAGERNGRLTLTSSTSATTALFLSADASNPAVTELGFPESSLTVDSVRAHAYVENVALEASFALAGSLAGSVSVGPVGLNGEVAGGGSMDVGLSLDDGRLSIVELLNGIASDPFELIDRDISGSMQVDVTELSVLGGFDLALPDTGMLLPDDVQIQVLVPDLSHPDFAELVQINYDDSLLGKLLSFENLTYDDILDALDSLAESLLGIGKQQLLDVEIPIVGVTAGKLIDLAQEVRTMVNELRSQEGQQHLLDELQQAMVSALAANGITFSQLGLDVVGNDVLFQLGWNQSGTSTLGLDLELSALGLDPGTLVSVDSTDALEISHGVDFNLVLGIDLNDPLAPIPFIRGDSGFEAGIMAIAPDVNLDITAVNVLPLFVRDGHLILDSNGIDDGPVGSDGDDPASFVVDVMGTASDKHPLFVGLIPQIPPFSVNLTGGADLALPLFFPDEATPLDDGSGMPNANELGVTVADLGCVLQGDFSNCGITASVPDFSGVQVELDDTLRVLLSGLERTFPEIAGAIDSLLNQPIPLIGTSLADLSDFDFVEVISSALLGRLETEFDSVVAPTQAAILNALNAELAGLAIDGNDAVTMSTTADSVTYNLEIGDTITTQIPLADYAGGSLLGLGLDIEGDAEVIFEWSIAFGLGVSETDGFFLDVDPADDEVHIGLDVELADASVMGSFAFLEVELQNKVTEVYDEGTYVGGAFTVNLEPPSGQSTIDFDDLTSQGLGSFIEVDVTGGAAVSFEATLSSSFAGGVIPSILNDFGAKWDLGEGSPDIAGFSNVRMDLGQFFSRFGDSIFEAIDSTLAPLRPILDMLDTRIPILSDFEVLRSDLDENRDGRVTIIEAAKLFGLADTRMIDSLIYIDQLRQQISEINDQVDDQSLIIPLGDLDLSGLSLSQPDGLADVDVSEPIDISTTVQDAIADPEVRMAILDFVGTTETPPPAGETEFAVPIFQDPVTTIFSLLLGRDVPLLTLDLAPINLDLEYRQFFPIFGPVGAEIAGRIGVKADLAFGYDIQGLSDFAASGYAPASVGSLLNGFFVFDRIDASGKPSFEGTDVDEVEFFAGVDIAGGVGPATAGGFIEGTVGLNLHDTDNDGRARFDEILACPFDLSGAIDAGLFASLEIGRGWFSYTKRWELARVTLVDASRACNPGEADLASLDNGALIISNDILEFDPLYRRISLEEDGEGGMVYRVSSGSRSEDFPVDNVSEIIVVGSPNDDRIIVDPEITLPTTMNGSDGNDVLQGGSGPNTLIGGDGDDQLLGGSDADSITGGSGNDTIISFAGDDVIDAGSGDDEVSAGEGNDSIVGGSGNDELAGEEGDDDIEGNDGLDRLDGGAGNDLLEGGNDNDIISGGDGNDTLIGGAGADLLAGGGDDDILYGHGDNSVPDDDAADELSGDGAEGDPDNQLQLPADSLPGDDTLFGGGGGDLLEGGEGDDELHGEAGDDTIFGGEGNDTAFGGFGTDTIDGQAGDDLLTGGVGDDTIFGGADHDTIFGTSGADKIYGGRGDDTIYGHNVTGLGDDAADDEVYGGEGNDQIFGDDGDDLLFGGSGDDAIEGGSGDDTINGDAGDDELLGQDGLDTIHGGWGDDRIYGLRDDDLLYGDAGNDFIEGGLGSDVIFGGGNRDRIYGHAEDDSDDDNSADVIYGDSGVGHPFGEPTQVGLGDRDILFGQGGNDQIFGELGRDDLFGNLGDDELDGGHGEDLLHGQSGDDLVRGGAGDDRIFGDDGNDQLHGGEGDDRAFGGAGQDVMYGDAGDDTLKGEAGDDSIMGGDGEDLLEGDEGEDLIYGEAGNDVLIAGTGVINVLLGGDGDDILYGSDEGGEDPNPNDAIFFGDQLSGDDGRDRIFGLGGADVIEGGAGDDFVDGGAHGDRIYGGAGHDEVRAATGDDHVEGGLGLDRLFGEAGNDVLIGNEDADFLDGGIGTDQLQGNDGADHLLGGGGVGDLLMGGNGSDHLEGSDDGADILMGEAGNDWIEGHGGNDHLQGGDGRDRLEGGPGDDLIEGEGGADDLLGGADHDVLYGHSQSGTNDDDAADAIYGDAGSGVAFAEAGNDRLFGGGGNDLLFGEAGDDFIDAGSGTDDRVEYGADEGANPDDFVTPSPTPPPAVQPTIQPDRYGLTLASGETESGRWAQLSGSASQDGISGWIAADQTPSVVFDSLGRGHVAWIDSRSGSTQVYVARHESSGWVELAGSASQGGISDSESPSRHPQVILNSGDQPLVAWIDGAESSGDLYVAEYDAAGDTWVALGASLSIGGISQSGTVIESAAAASASGEIVAWIEQVGGLREIHVRRWDGSNWQQLGGSIVASAADVANLELAVDGTDVAVVWSQSGGGSTNVFVKQLIADVWQELAGSGSATGISMSADQDSQPTATWHSGELFVAWTRVTDTANELRSHIAARRFDGAQWVAAGSDIGSELITSGENYSNQPQVVSSAGELSIVWNEDLARRNLAEQDGIYRLQWSGSRFETPATQPADFGNLGISYTGGEVSGLTAVPGPNGQRAVAWVDSQSGTPRLYLRQHDVDDTNTSFVNDSASLQALIDSATLSAGDIVYMTLGDYGVGATISSSVNGVHFVGAPGLRISGPLVFTDAQNVTLQNVDAADVTLAGGSNVTLRDSRLESVIAQGGSGHLVSQVDINSLATGLHINGSASGLRVENSRIEGAPAVRIDAVADFELLSNRIVGVTIGIDIVQSFTGQISDNDVTGRNVGIRYLADGLVSKNDIHDSAVGVQVGGSPPLPTVVFGGLPGSEPNTIRNNVIGVDVRHQVIGQFIYGNDTGATGPGRLGGDSFVSPNVLQANTIGSTVSGNVQFNRFIDNQVGIESFDKQLVAHNAVSGEGLAGIRVSGSHDTRVVNNTVHQRTGNAVEVIDGATETEVRGNVLWVESGTALHVSDDAQDGFFSDYNQLHIESGATLVHYSLDFFDLLDWQADVARFDLHSIGTTVIDPLGAEPRVQSVATGDYTPAALIAQQSRTSVGVDAGDLRTDLGLAPSTINYLMNPGFESSLTGWTTNLEASSGGNTTSSFEEDSHFIAGQTPLAFAEQTVDLLAAGFDSTQLDAGDLRFAFGARLRFDAEAPVGALVSLQPLDAGGSPLGAAITAVATRESQDRWELVGDVANIPAGARFARLTIQSERLATSGDNPGRFDNAWLKVIADTDGANIGETGHTELDAPAQNDQPTIHLRFPDLYTDWERDQPRDILWQSFGNETESTVDILLYVDGAHGPEFVSTIATGTNDDGSFNWIPANSGVDFGTHDLRIEVRLTSDAYAADRSVETFSVAEDTATYFVNDQSQVDDTYTTATGDNRNTGRLASAPKPLPANVLRTYSLGSSDTLFTDAGDYQVFDSVLVSNSAAFGNDEGFTWTGPTSGDGTASLYDVHPISLEPLVEFNDADQVTIQYLTLDDAHRGIYVHNGSTRLTASWLSLSGHTEDGILIEDDSEDTVLQNLTVSNNGAYGIHVLGPIGQISDSTVTNNVGRGIHAEDQAGVLISGNHVESHLDYGIYFTGIAGDQSVVESNVVSRSDRGIYADAFSGAIEVRDNHVFDNRVHGIEARYFVTVVGNAVHDNSDRGILAESGATATENVVFQNSVGIFLGDGSSGNNSHAFYNRVYNNLVAGIQVRSSSDVIGNTVYSNPIGVYAPGLNNRRYLGNLSNNLVYDNSGQAIYLRRADGTEITNNTIRHANGDAIWVDLDSEDVQLRNNIVSLIDATGIRVSTNSEVGFDSDFNLFDVSGDSHIGFWQNTDRTQLLSWQTAIAGDVNSLTGDPLFVDPAGADGVLGFVDATNDGRDDDFHLQSTVGRFTGSLTPVFNTVTGFAEFLPVMELTDSNQSPAIDRGWDVSAFDQEALPSGGFVNLGAWGNTPHASKSPVTYVLVTSPDGGESTTAGQVLSLQWRTETQGVGTVDLTLVRDDDPLFAYTIATATANDGVFDWTVDPAVAANVDYRLMVERNDLPGLTDTSNDTFEIADETNSYFVNIAGDSDFSDNEFTTAAGDDANSGLGAASPRASIRSILDDYQLQAGDTIFVDTGVYTLSTNIVITAADQGVRIVGASGVGHETVLDRDNISTGSSVFELVDADDIVLESLSITGGWRGVSADTNSDSTNVTIRNSRLYENSDSEVYFGRTNSGLLLNGNEIFENSGMSGSGVQLFGNTTDSHTVVNNVFSNHSTALRISGGDGHTVTGNTVFDNFSTGINVSGVVGTNVISGNEVFGNRDGIIAIASTSATLRVEQNDVHDNSRYGVDVTGGIVEDNAVWANATGIYIESGVAIGNEVFSNSGSGIFADGANPLVEGNTVFANDTGVQGGDGNGLFSGTFQNNVVNNNLSRGIWIVRGRDGAVVRNNTVYQPQGTGVLVSIGSEGVQLRNNIIETHTDAAIEVTADSQIDFQSDFNLVYTPGAAILGLWGSTAYDDRADWFYELGLGGNSLAGETTEFDPLFVDTTFDFRLMQGSPAIDAGNPLDDFSNEPGSNGGRINLGAWGNTSEAANSPAEVIQVLTPNGLEKYESGDNIRITWHQHGDFELPTVVDAYRQTVVNQAPVGYWQFDELSGATVAVDQVGGNDGTYVGSPVLGAGGALESGTNTTISFDGVDDSVEIADDGTLDLTHNVSMSLWMNLDSFTGTTIPLVSKGNGFTTTTYQLTVHQDGYLQLATRNGSSYVTVRTADNTIVPGTWYHITGVIDRDSGEMKIFVDGNELAADTFDFPSDAVSNTDPLRVGDSTSSTHFAGRIDELAIYNRPLSEREADALARPRSARVSIELVDAVTQATIPIVSDAVLAGGHYDWTIPASVPVDRAYRMRITAEDGLGVVQDLSNEPFLIANDGVNYYVNLADDQDLSDNEFTTTAGSNANTGKTPDSPLAGIQSLLDAFDLEPGSTIFVDTGVYTLSTNIMITAADQGVRIVGASGAGHETVLDRNNTSTGSSVFELVDADDITLENLSITGGWRGVSADLNSDSTNVTIRNSRLYGNSNSEVYFGRTNSGLILDGNEIFEDSGQSGSGVQLFGNTTESHTVINNVFHNHSTALRISSGAGHTVSGNIVFDNFSTGINVTGVVGTNVISGNEVFDNRDGIVASEGTGGTLRVEQNDVHDNSRTGIDARGTVENNTVWANATGIFIVAGAAIDNEVFSNLGSGIIVRGSDSLIEGNTVFANDTGVVGGDNLGFFTGSLQNNVVYNNVSRGIWIAKGRDGAVVRNNTVYQPQGTGVLVSNASYGIQLRNNIIETHNDAAIEVTPDSQIGFQSDFNLIYTPGNGILGRWGSTEYDDQADWFYELGLGSQTMAGDTAEFDPQFVDATFDFRVLAGSPAIDAGRPVDDFSNEPSPNGGRINIGAWGNTSEAASSPAEVIQVLTPNGLEKYENGDEITITWHQHGDFELPSVVDAYRQTVVNQGPVGYWQFDELPGATVAVDQIAGNDGTYVGSPTLGVSAALQDGTNTAVSFDGVDDSVEIADDGTFDLTRNVSMSFWMNVDSFTGVFSIPLVSKGSGGATYQLGLRQDGSLEISTRSGNSGQSVRTADGTIVPGTWYHVTGVIDRDGGEMKIFVNGDELASESFAFPSDATSASDSLRVGDTNSITHFAGRIDELAIYDRPLSEREADALARPRSAVVSIDLVDADTQATVLPIVSDTVLAGGFFDWTIPASVPVDRAYQIRVTAEQSVGQIEDLSNAPFLIVNDGQEYFVNISDDADLTDNAFTTVAGDNANTGKSADSPLASLETLLRAYDLDPGDVVYIDSGDYLLQGNLRLQRQDSGVTLRGVNDATRSSRLLRGSTADGSYVIEFDRADDITIDSVSLTGGYHGIYAPTNFGGDNITILNSRVYDNAREQILISSNNDDWTISSSEVFANGGNSYAVRALGHNFSLLNSEIHDARNGVWVSGFGATVRDNSIFDNTNHGLFVQISNDPSLRVEGNQVFGNQIGIEINHINTTAPVLVTGNRVFDNSSDGIVVTGSTLISQNEVFNNLGYGIHAERDGIVEDNLVYENGNGILLGQSVQSASAFGNRVYGNSGTGILVGNNSRAEGNLVYSNSVGIHGLRLSRDFTGNILDNLVYANVNQGIRLTDADSGAIVSNNTVYQSVGDAVRVENNSNDIRLYNNILWVDSGYTMYFASNSQTGHVSDYNLFHTTSAAAYIGFWDGADQSTLGDWQLLTGMDMNSIQGDPLFIDVDGFDNVLGWDDTGVGYDGGGDDNFVLSKNSPAIDSGYSWATRPSDLQGTLRRDDVGTVNSGGLEYFDALTTNTAYPPGAGEVAQGWRSSNNSWQLSLPFSFPFYGESYSSLYVSSNGFLQFGDNTNASDSSNTTAELLAHKRIAPLWDNLSTSATGDDIYVDQSVAGQTTIRWEARNLADNSDVNIAVTLYDTGTVDFHYDAGNVGLSPTVGISGGNGLANHISAYDGASNLTQAPSVRYELAVGYADMGAFEFRGNSLDDVAPLVTEVSVGVAAPPIAPDTAEVLTIDFSEEMNSLDANAVDAYELQVVDANGSVSFFTVMPQFAIGDSSVTLQVVDGPLPVGDYTLTIFSQATRGLTDTAGLGLDGDGDLIPGGDFVYEFTIGSVTGDFDQDGDFDIVDIDALIMEIASGGSNLAFDLTGDGNVDLADRNQWLAAAGQANLPSGNAYLLGDANLDGFVDVSDLNLWSSNKFTSHAAWSGADFNADGFVDISDLNIWSANKFLSADATASQEPVTDRTEFSIGFGDDDEKESAKRQSAFDRVFADEHQFAQRFKS